MKNIFSLITAGIIGGFIAVFAIDVLETKNMDEVANRSPSTVLTSATGIDLPPNFVDAAEKITSTVVHITVEESRELAAQRRNKQNRERGFGFFDLFDMMEQDYPRSGMGSGVVLSSDGYVVTNNHVIEGGDLIKISLGGREYDAQVIGKDPSTDLAVLKINATGLEYAQFGNSDNVRVGEWVAAIGNPFSYLRSTVTAGIVSAKGRDIDILQNGHGIEEFIQTDAAINPGNSGGALVNPEGEVIGINTAIATPTGVYAGYSFAIPSNIVQRIVKDIIENGDIERGRLGVLGRTVDSIIKQENNLKRNKGFLVEDVLKASSAQYAGVLPGDIIVGVNGKSVVKFEDLYEVIEFAKVGDTINLIVFRKNKEIEIPVYLRKGI